MSEKHLRTLIRLLLAEEKEEKKIIGEPDLSSEDERDEPEFENNEQSVVSSIRGVTTPLGTGPTYPAGKGKKRTKRKSPAAAAGAVFGNAKPVKKA